MDSKQTIQAYYQFVKPGIIYANLLTAVAGYLLASHLHIKPLVAAGLLVGLTLVIAGACASNNIMDRRIDTVMARTKKRALVAGTLSLPAAYSIAAAATLSGLLVLAVTQNKLTTLLAIVAWIDYVILYGWSKRRTVHGTLVGCICGSLSLVMGYTAVMGRLDVAAWLLFGVMVAWQMAHFYGIALYRQQDYAAAHIPVMPVVYGARTTQWQSMGYVGLFCIFALLLGLYGVVSGAAAVLLAAVGIWWLWGQWTSLPTLPALNWGKRSFLTSLKIMLVLCLVLSFGWLGR